MTRIDCRQLTPWLGDLAGNVARSTDAIRQAVAGGADVVLLPELVTSGYMFETRDEVEAVAVTPDHDLFGRWAEAARGAVVAAGFAERTDDGRLYNSAVLLDAGGVLAVYRKTHLWDREKLFFTAGEALPPVVDTRVGRIGLLVCYDLEFPELTRGLVLGGADLLAVPTNWPLSSRPPHERAPEVQNAMVTARLNRVAVACADRTGTERGQAWTEGTAVVDADGWVAAAVGSGEGSACADIDLARSRDKALTPLCDVIGDRRPELYRTGPLLG